MLKGLEIGMLPMQALDSIDVIAATCHQTAGNAGADQSKGLLESMKIEDDSSTCTVTMKRKGETEPYVEAFGMARRRQDDDDEWDGAKDVLCRRSPRWKAGNRRPCVSGAAIAACCRTASRMSFRDVHAGRTGATCHRLGRRRYGDYRPTACADNGFHSR